MTSVRCLDRADPDLDRRWLRRDANVKFDNGLLDGHRHMPLFTTSRDRNQTQASKSIDVIVRFGLRLTAITVFALFAGIGLHHGLVIMLWMSAMLSAVIATVEQDEPLGGGLNHWDEAIAYAALCCLACTI
jgi:hypothetical protein